MENEAALGIFLVLYVGFILAIAGLMIYSLWRVFEKAGEEGWKSIIPIYNTWTLYEISGKPGWWSLIGFAALIPFLGLLAIPAIFVLHILAMIGLSRNFKAGDGFVVGLILLPVVFYPILAFGDYQYHGGEGESLEDKIDNIGGDQSNEGGSVEEINVKDW
ncbi:MAG: DUF5684 domain-containing protein [Bacteroidota bacterium]